MKYLIALSLFQAIALIFFGARVMEIDARTSDIAKVVETDAAQLERGLVDPYTAKSSTIYSPTVDEIRQMLREEIAALEGLSSPGRDRRSAENRRDNNSRSEVNTASAVDNLYLQDTVVRDIDSYIGLGRIAPAQMAELQMKIARLPPADRRAMLSRLTKAMNAGDLEGEF